MSDSDMYMYIAEHSLMIWHLVWYINYTIGGLQRLGFIANQIHFYNAHFTCHHEKLFFILHRIYYKNMIFAQAQNCPVLHAVLRIVLLLFRESMY